MSKFADFLFIWLMLTAGLAGLVISLVLVALAVLFLPVWASLPLLAVAFTAFIAALLSND